MKRNLMLIYNNIFYLKLIVQLIVIIITAFSCIENVFLIDENQDINYVNTTDSNSSEQNKTHTEDGTVKSTNQMTEFELKMQKFMSKHMDNYLSDLRKDIQNSDNSANSSDSTQGTMGKEDLENTYYNEVNFKLEVDSLTNKLEKELAIKESSSSNENFQDSKRTAEDTIDSKNKKTKK